MSHIRFDLPNTSRLVRCSRWLALVAVTGTAMCEADEPREDWQPYFRSLAQSYAITADSHPDAPFALHPEPILRWSQPVRGGDDGAVYLWLQDGVPAAVGTMFCWPHVDGYRVVVNEFHSFASEPLTARRDDQTPWMPRTPGITWTVFNDAPAIAATPALRLTQMRRLVARFEGENIDDSGSDRAWPLRLMPTPLHRFDLSQTPASEPRAVMDGALFALASGTDPEIFILIAARRTPEGDRWHWDLARFSDLPLRATLDGAEVFAVPRAQPHPEKPHTCFDVAQLQAPSQPPIPNPQPLAQ
jgi:hypothetical protein